MAPLGEGEANGSASEADVGTAAAHGVSGVFVPFVYCLASLNVVSLFRFNLSPLELGGGAGDSDSCKRGTVFLQLAAATGGSVSNPH